MSETENRYKSYRDIDKGKNKDKDNAKSGGSTPGNSNNKKHPGRPKSSSPKIEPVNEIDTPRLDMSKASKYGESDVITIDDITKRWKSTFDTIAGISLVDKSSDISTVTAKWNKLNPFLQNQRIKNLYTNAHSYNKVNISEFLASPAYHEKELRSLGWANSSSQQIYYNILRRSCDIPNYFWYIIPDLLPKESDYKSDDFVEEYRVVEEWMSMFSVASTLKTIAMEVKREGKSTYLLRNKITGTGSNKHVNFCTLQKMPSDWIKITGKGQLGFTISFNMMYFMNIANSPSDFGDFMVEAWNDMIETGVVTRDYAASKYVFNVEKAVNYKFTYNNITYSSSIESISGSNGHTSKIFGDKVSNYLFWLVLPYDMCFTFGSDNSQPWVAPDTMGLMLKLQELTDYGQLAGLIASTPLTAVLTGEIDTIDGARAGKNESIFAPEVLRGYMDQFNAATSTNVEAWLWPAKNVKLQQLNSDVNSSDIINTATQNFIESAGEGGLTIATDKPNVAQVTVAKQMAASQQRYVTLQFEHVLNFIIQNKLGLKYRWKISLWGDVFNANEDKKFLKEIVAGGNIALLPKLMSAEGISMRDAKAIVGYVNSLDIYKDFKTYTQISQADLSSEAMNDSSLSNSNNPKTPDGQEDSESKSVGRPSISDDEVENDASASSKDRGDNIAGNRDVE